ncbi:hypothetical protein [Nocardia stercoris]|uniref:Secreted protein n=1 Tax=Nocardia stercoris TaxID=2483361 RepID=A0A3M2LCJ5_9NOCA|nr:hypothetical protein [Nocardia stercoris]RMI35231.1 hypothetical protein EBN03_02775 [Nocardia stercoris]
MKPLIPTALAGFAALAVFSAPAEAATTTDNAPAADIATCAASVGSGLIGIGTDLGNGAQYLELGPFNVGSGAQPSCGGLVPPVNLGSAWVSLS